LLYIYIFIYGWIYVQLVGFIFRAASCTVGTLKHRYIDYNVKKLAKPGAISRHTDNDSMVTMVVPVLSGDAAEIPCVQNPWPLVNITRTVGFMMK
jgi:hypothetical protein